MSFCKTVFEMFEPTLTYVIDGRSPGWYGQHNTMEYIDYLQERGEKPFLIRRQIYLSRKLKANEIEDYYNKHLISLSKLRRYR